MYIQLHNGVQFIKQNDTGSQVQFQILGFDKLPYDLTDKNVEVVIGNELGRLLVKSATVLDALDGIIEWGLDEGDVLPSGTLELEVHIQELDGDMIVAPSKKYYKLRVEQAIDELDVVVTTYTLQYFLDQASTTIEKIGDMEVATAEAVAAALNANNAATNAQARATLAYDAATNANTRATQAQTATNQANTARDAANLAATQADQAKEDAENAANQANTARLATQTATSQANTARDAANQAASNAQTQANRAEDAADVLEGLEVRGAYNAGTAYVKNNIVTFNGSSYIAKVNTQGNPPPTDSTVPENTQWSQIGRKGTDSTGITGTLTKQLVSTAGQTVITLDQPYDMFQNRIFLFIEGVHQPNTAYAETSATTITLTEPLEAGLSVVVMYFAQVPSLASDLQTTVDNHTTVIGQHSTQLAELEQEFDTAVGAMTEDSEVVLARDSAVKGKTFTTLDGRLEAQEVDTYIPMTNLVVNGDFSNGTTGWGAENSFAFDVNSEGKGRIYNNGIIAVSRLTQLLPFKTSSKYYVSIRGLFRNDNSSSFAVQVYDFVFASKYQQSFSSTISNFSDVFELSGDLSATSRFTLIANSMTVSTSSMFTFDDIVLVNLTETFGKGKEPTKEEMDRLLAKYPNSFFDGTVNLTPKLLDDLRYLTSDVQMPMKNLIPNGDFSKGTTGWSFANGSASVNNKRYRVIPNVGITFFEPRITLNTKVGVGDVLYMKSRFLYNGYLTRLSHMFNQGGTQVAPEKRSSVYAPNIEHTVSDIITASPSQTSNSPTFYLGLYYATGATADAYVEFMDIAFINLTEVFGAGNEPTKAQMDALLATYPNSWFDGTVNLAENKRIIPFLLKRLELKADKAQEAWITPTLLNGATGTFKYRKNTIGQLEIMAYLTNTPYNQTLFQFPSGYRPSTTSFIGTMSNSDSPIRFSIGTDGFCSLRGTSTSAICSINTVIAL